MPTEHEAVEPRPTLREVLTNAINRCSAENGSNTPDFILAETLVAFLGAFNHGVTERDRWYGVALRPRPRDLPDPNCPQCLGTGETARG